MNSVVPGSAWWLTAENTTMDIAVVGPETKWRDEPNNEAIMGVTIAVYKPYSGGKPAIVAKAMPCGKTITAPVRPANKSALMDSFVINLNQTRKGNIDSILIFAIIVMNNRYQEDLLWKFK